MEFEVQYSSVCAMTLFVLFPVAYVCRFLKFVENIANMLLYTFVAQIMIIGWGFIYLVEGAAGCVHAGAVFAFL